jgi:hypothetical protein
LIAGLVPKSQDCVVTCLIKFGQLGRLKVALYGCVTEANLREIDMTVISVVRYCAMALFAVVAFGAPSYAQQPSGDIRIDIVSGGFILGAAGGSGTLVYGGKRYRLSIGGLSVGATIGLAKASFYGRAYNLRRVTDIQGTYTAADVGYAIIGGRKTARLKNGRGVVLELRGRQIGLEATADVSGMQISLR